MPGRSAAPAAGDPDGFDRMWQAVAPLGRDGRTGGYRRFAWTREDHDLREWFSAACLERDLDVTSDRMGNQWAWWGDPDAAAAAGHPGVVMGSHLDSVPDGGAFDGPLGVVGSLAALDRLRAAGVRPARPIGVVAFADEEGARFGIACAGSRVVTGQLDAGRALGLTDSDGVTMAEAMASAGHDPAAVGPDPRTVRRIGAFVELHIEQGAGLVDLGQAVAVGTGIHPHGRWRVEVPGVADHAGTTRLADRRDAVIGLAEVVLAARAAAVANGCLATVGRVDVRPGAVNAVASRATGWLDARGPAAGAVRRTVDEVRAVAVRHGGRVVEESWTPATSFDAPLGDRLARLLGGVPRLATGAGHDAGILATAGVPTAMLFVRNPTGVSHSPAEAADPADCHAGVAALARVVAELAG